MCFDLGVHAAVVTATKLKLPTQDRYSTEKRGHISMP
jgi:hypothetical protein